MYFSCPHLHTGSPKSNDCFANVSAARFDGAMRAVVAMSLECNAFIATAIFDFPVPGGPSITEILFLHEIFRASCWPGFRPNLDDIVFIFVPISPLEILFASRFCLAATFVWRSFSVGVHFWLAATFGWRLVCSPNIGPLGASQAPFWDLLFQ